MLTMVHSLAPVAFAPVDQRAEDIQTLRRRVVELSRAAAAAEASELRAYRAEDEVRALRTELAEALRTKQDRTAIERIGGWMAEAGDGLMARWRGGCARLIAGRWVLRADDGQCRDLVADPVILDDEQEPGWIGLDQAGRILVHRAGSNVVIGQGGCPPQAIRGGGGVVWQDSSGHIWLWDGGHAPIDLSQETGVTARGSIAAWYWAQEGSRHVVCTDDQGRIQELLELEDHWYATILSDQCDAPWTAGPLTGYAPQDHEHVVYADRAGRLHQLIFDGLRWQHAPMQAHAAPPCFGRPAAAYVNGIHTVCWVAPDGGLHCLRHRHDWRHQQLCGQGSCAGEAVLIPQGDGAVLGVSTPAGGRRFLVMDMHGQVRSMPVA